MRDGAPSCEGRGHVRPWPDVMEDSILDLLLFLGAVRQSR
jgi:hypothetical protein